jgi:hypothetical protein
MEKRGLKPLGIVAIFVAVIVVAIAGFVLFTPHSPTSTGKAISAVSKSIGMPLSSSPYANYAYLISGETLSPEAQQALAGFQLNSTLNGDGSTTYVLTAVKQNYYNQTYTIKPGQNLYFIERSMGDDNVADNDDYNLGDDFAIVVDSSGNIIQGPNMTN